MNSRTKFLAWKFVDAIEKSSEPALYRLSSEMNLFYNSAAFSQDYWIKAGNLNDKWIPETHPFHLDLKKRIAEGSSVSDFGCGNGHVYNNLRDKSVTYTGYEWSEEQVQEIQNKYPEAKFLSGDITTIPIESKVDWAISLFVLEHCVRPDLLLSKMYESVKVGGKMAIICPHFKHGMNSIRTGFRATTKKDKLKKFQLIDFLISFWQEKYVIPRRVRKLHDSEWLFPIYLKPRCLNAEYYSDNDAVYLTNENKIKKFLTSFGATIILDAATLNNQSDVIYLIAQKTA